MDPQIGTDILNRYYYYLQHDQQHLLVALYRPGSLMARLDNGVLTERAYTINVSPYAQELDRNRGTYHDLELQWCHFSGISWVSWGHGILVVIFDSLRREGFRGRHNFVQTLVIAPSTPDNSFFICNDVFNFVDFIDDESIPSTLSPDITTDNNNNDIALSNVAGSELASQREPIEFDDLVKSDPSDESSTTVELGSLCSFTDSLAYDLRSLLSDTSLDIEDLTLDQQHQAQDQDQQQSNPENVNRELPVQDAEDNTDLESLTTKANKLSIQPPTDGV